MEINNYQEWTRTTAIYPKDKALEYLILGLTSEAGEVAGKLKKGIRDGISPTFQSDLLSEVGDVYWYLARIIDELGATSTDVLASNFDKLTSRKVRSVLGGSGDNG